MTDHGRHCPFLNRADARCSKHFSLDHLGHAFDYCFGYYEGCGVYLQLLAERRVRRARGHAYDGAGDEGNFYGDGTGGQLTQLTIAGRHPDGIADPAVVSHAPGL
jgi:hypothetical protein